MLQKGEYLAIMKNPNAIVNKGTSNKKTTMKIIPRRREISYGSHIEALLQPIDSQPER